ncbi:DUF2490 domain-containing protein [Spirosoma sp. BT702]|uniref:DUF2490 domain-containing protein n=1 Tax=Spirosoma profusum TaxID=2771354 RepID=A0A926XYD7_9BACT|nr:DUF2490 domain-containing protein [Spirosoma profusum]MBD2703042.1 DUF2490 domain-containing protein [Spirosoma profusum]
MPLLLPQNQKFSKRLRLNKWLLTSILTGSLPFYGWSQTGTVGLWTGVSAELKLSKAFSIQGTSQLRFTDNLNVTGAYLGELGISYNLTKHWQLSGYYRYVGRRKFDKDIDEYYYRPYHRFYGELSFDHKLGKRIKLDYRLRYQNQFKDDAEGLVADKSYLRNKLELSLNTTSRFSPFVSADLFYRLGDEDSKGLFDQVRVKAGLSTDLSPNGARFRHSIDLSVFNDVPLNGNEASEIIIGATYKLKIGLKKK